MKSNLRHIAAITLIITLFCSTATAIAHTSSKRKAKAKAKTAATSGYKDGVWAGKGSGYMGVVGVNVTIKNGKITKVDVTDDDTPQYMDMAKKGTIPAILDKQSSKVDGVTGATYSSEGIKQAVDQALKKAKK